MRLELGKGLHGAVLGCQRRSWGSVQTRKVRAAPGPVPRCVLFQWLMNFLQLSDTLRSSGDTGIIAAINSGELAPRIDRQDPPARGAPSAATSR